MAPRQTTQTRATSQRSTTQRRATNKPATKLAAKRATRVTSARSAAPRKATAGRIVRNTRQGKEQTIHSGVSDVRTLEIAQLRLKAYQILLDHPSLGDIGGSAETARKQHAKHLADWALGLNDETETETET